MTSGFVETFSAGVCRGSYAEPLARAWRAWDAEHSSLNEPVDELPEGQLFAVIGMADSGRDLEAFDVGSYAAARGLLLQVALSLAVAEEAVGFEHRDLHWGNVLIKPCKAPRAEYRLRGAAISAATGGVAATLIDFTASRLVTMAGDLAFCDLAGDPELFQGPKGDCQACGCLLLLPKGGLAGGRVVG